MMTPALSEGFRGLRESAGLSQYALAKRAGLSKQGMSCLEMEEREPTWITVQRIAGALGVSCEAFTDPDIVRMAQNPEQPARPGRPRRAAEGVPFDLTVTAVDPFGQLAAGYTGTVTFSTTDPDPGVVLPADYTFTLADGGVHTFTDTGLGETTLVTPGDQMLTVTDTADDTITGSAVVTVGSTAPGTGSHGLGGQPQPGRLQGSAPPTSEPSYRQVIAVDRWFAALNKRDVGLALAPPVLV
jgi:DNA-binding XRE family transcriptional regulator